MPTSESRSAYTSPQYPGLPLQQAISRVVAPAHATSSRQGPSTLAVGALIASLLGLLMTVTSVLVATAYIFGDFANGQRPWFEHYAYIALHFTVALIALVLAIVGIRRHPGWMTILALALASVAFNDSLLRAYFRVITQLKWGR